MFKNNENLNLIVEILDEARIKDLSIYKKSKEVGLEYKIIKKLENDINENLKLLLTEKENEIKLKNSIFNNFRLLQIVFDDISFHEEYFKRIKNDSYAGINYEIKDILFLKNEMDYFFNINEESVDLKSIVLEKHVKLYFRFLFNVNNLCLSDKELEIKNLYK